MGVFFSDFELLPFFVMISNLVAEKMTVGQGKKVGTHNDLDNNTCNIRI